MWRKFLEITNHYKIVRGMLSYGTLWPCGSLIEQTLVEQRTFQTYDWKKCVRFSVFGFFCLGPAMYCWVRVANMMWPRSDIKSAMCKAFTEQVAYDPFAIAAFFFTMTLMEGKTAVDAKRELSSKFFDAYKVGFVYWPCVQTLNFSLVHPKNQVVVTSLFSMLWTAFLAYVKYLELQEGKHTFELHWYKLYK